MAQLPLRSAVPVCEEADACRDPAARRTPSSQQPDPDPLARLTFLLLLARLCCRRRFPNFAPTQGRKHLLSRPATAKSLRLQAARAPRSTAISRISLHTARRTISGHLPMASHAPSLARPLSTPSTAFLLPTASSGLPTTTALTTGSLSRSNSTCRRYSSRSRPRRVSRLLKRLASARRLGSCVRHLVTA